MRNGASPCSVACRRARTARGCQRLKPAVASGPHPRVGNYCTTYPGDQGWSLCGALSSICSDPSLDVC